MQKPLPTPSNMAVTFLKRLSHGWFRLIAPICHVFQLFCSLHGSYHSLILCLLLCIISTEQFYPGGIGREGKKRPSGRGRELYKVTKLYSILSSGPVWQNSGNGFIVRMNEENCIVFLIHSHNENISKMMPNSVKWHYKIGKGHFYPTRRSRSHCCIVLGLCFGKYHGPACT